MIKLTEKQKQLVEENINLAYSFANQNYTKVALIYDYDEVLSICFESLTRASIYYSEDKNIKFSTFAYKCMKRNLFEMYNKELEKHKSLGVISIDQFRTEDEFSLLDILASDVDIEAQILINDKIEHLYKATEKLSKELKTIILLRLDNKTFEEIANITNKNPAAVHRKYKEALNKLRNYFGGYRND